MSDFVDTNIIVRFLARDDPDMTAPSGRLFARAQGGELTLFTSEAVLLEVVQVMTSPRLYLMERGELAEAMRTLLENRWFHLDHKTVVLDAFALYGQTKLDFTDCLAIEHCRRHDGGVV